MAALEIHAGRTVWLVRRPGGPFVVVGIERAPFFLAWLARLVR